jgi:hypothetical protein
MDAWGRSGAGDGNEDAQHALDTALDWLEATLTSAEALTQALRTDAALLIAPVALERAKLRLERAHAAGDPAREARAAAVYQIVASAQGRSAEELANAEVRTGPTPDELPSQLDLQVRAGTPQLFLGIGGPLIR